MTQYLHRLSRSPKQLVVNQPASPASSALTQAGYVHTCRDDNVGAVEEMMYVMCVTVTEEGIVVMDVFWRQLCITIL